MRYIGHRSASRPAYPLYDHGALTDPATVEANRNGILTLDQRAMLQKPLRRIGFFSVTVIVLSGLALFGLMIALTLVPFHLGPLYSGTAGVSAWDVVTGIAKSACSLPFAVMGLAMAFAAVASPIQAVRSLRMTRLDLESGQIVQSEGEVLQRWYGYMVTVTNGFRGWKAESRNVPLPPGRYRFYLLPRSGRLLSAEPLRPLGAIPGDPREDPTARLPDGAPKVGELARVLTPAEGTALLGALASANRFSME